MRDEARTGAKRAAADPGSRAPEEVQAPRGPTSSGGEAPLERPDEPLRLVHHHPGYVRVRAGAFLQPAADNPTLAAARAAAEALPGFRSWSHNPMTGSAVIEYDPAALEADDLLKHIASGAGFPRLEVATRIKMNRQELVSAFMDGVQDINRTFGQLTGERTDLRELVPVALAAVSVVSFVVNDPSSRLPHWFSSLYRSYRVFMHWHRREVRARERVARQAEERAASES